MKKVLCSFIVIVLSLVLSCCTTENTQKETVNAEPLTDGTATYYENEKDMNGKLLHSTRYTKDGRIVEEYEYSYTYDINGKLTTIRKTDLNSGNYIETYFDRFKTKIDETVFNSDGQIKNKREFMENGCVKKSYIYKNGAQTGYILYDYYSDKQLKNETVYALDGKTVKMTTSDPDRFGRMEYSKYEYDTEGRLTKQTDVGFDGRVEKDFTGEKTDKVTTFDWHGNETSTTLIDKETQQPVEKHEIIDLDPYDLNSRKLDSVTKYDEAGNEKEVTVTDKETGGEVAHRIYNEDGSCDDTVVKENGDEQRTHYTNKEDATRVSVNDLVAAGFAAEETDNKVEKSETEEKESTQQAGTIDVVEFHKDENGDLSPASGSHMEANGDHTEWRYEDDDKFVESYKSGEETPYRTDVYPDNPEKIEDTEDFADSMRDYVSGDSYETLGEIYERLNEEHGDIEFNEVDFVKAVTEWVKDEYNTGEEKGGISAENAADLDKQVGNFVADRCSDMSFDDAKEIGVNIVEMANEAVNKDEWGRDEAKELMDVANGMVDKSEADDWIDKTTEFVDACKEAIDDNGQGDNMFDLYPELAPESHQDEGSEGENDFSELPWESISDGPDAENITGGIVETGLEGLHEVGPDEATEAEFVRKVDTEFEEQPEAAKNEDIGKQFDTEQGNVEAGEELKPDAENVAMANEDNLTSVDLNEIKAEGTMEGEMPANAEETGKVNDLGSEDIAAIGQDNSMLENVQAEQGVEGNNPQEIEMQSGVDNNEEANQGAIVAEQEAEMKEVESSFEVDNETFTDDTDTEGWQ